MQIMDYYSEPESYAPGVHLSTESIATLTRLMRELRELTQSRATYVAASDLLAQLTGERDSTLVKPDVLAQ